MEQKTEAVLAPAAYIRPPQFGTAADNYRMLRNFRNETIVTKQWPVDVVFTGDSVTHLWEIQGYFRRFGYIVNSGISGDVAQVLARRLAADVVQLKPKVCVVLIGINNTLCLDEAGNTQTPDDICRLFADSYVSILDQLKAASIRPVVCAVTPVHGEFAGHDRNALVRRMNGILRELCSRYGVPYADYYTALAGEDGAMRRELSWDGLHPHVIGYDRMAAVLSTILEQELKGRTTNG